MKVLLFLIIILPYLFLSILTSVGHLFLCLWFWKEPKLGFWTDLIWRYKLFVRDIEKDLSPNNRRNP